MHFQIENKPVEFFVLWQILVFVNALEKLFSVILVASKRATRHFWML